MSNTQLKSDCLKTWLRHISFKQSSTNYDKITWLAPVRLVDPSLLAAQKAEQYANRKASSPVENKDIYDNVSLDSLQPNT